MKTQGHVTVGLFLCVLVQISNSCMYLASGRARFGNMSEGISSTPLNTIVASQLEMCQKWVQACMLT